MTRQRIGIVLCGLIVLVSLLVYRHATHQPQRQLPTRLLTVAGQSLLVEVATTSAQRQRGLMYRTTLAEGQGMLFVFERPGVLTFWMKHTTIPLSIAFLDARGTILNIQDMQPYDRTEHRSTAFAQYALEVPRGFFLAHQITIGDNVTGLPD